MTPRRAALSSAAAAALLAFSTAACASGVDPDAALGDTARLTPGNAAELDGDLDAALDFAIDDVKALEGICDRVDRAAAGEALGGDLSPYDWYDGTCVFEIFRTGAARAEAPDRLVIAMITADGGPDRWRATRKVLRLTFPIDEVEGVGDDAFFAPPTSALYVVDGSTFVLFQHVAGSGPAPDGIAEALAGIATGALGT